MTTKLCIISSTILLMLARPASAGWVYFRDGSRYYQFEGPDFAILAYLLIVGGGFALFVYRVLLRPEPPPRTKTADEYNAEAVLLAAKRHHTEMISELRKAEIEAARVEAIHSERNEIIAHDRKVRDLNARLDEQRRSS
jgi:hypothetical protein